MCFSAVVDVSRNSGHTSRFSWGGPHTLINFGLLACKWKRAKRIQTNKDQERNCQQPWLTGVGDCHDLTGSRLRVLTQLWYKIMQVLSLDQLTSVLFTSHPLQTAFLAHRLRLSTTTTPSSPPHLQDYLQYHSITVQKQMQNCHTFPWTFTPTSIMPLIPHHSSACGPWPQRGGSCSPAAALWSSRMTWSLRSHRAAAAACTAPRWSPQTPWISVASNRVTAVPVVRVLKLFSCIRLAVPSLWCTGYCFYLKYSILYTHSTKV